MDGDEDVSDNTRKEVRTQTRAWKRAAQGAEEQQLIKETRGRVSFVPSLPMLIIVHLRAKGGKESGLRKCV